MQQHKNMFSLSLIDASLLSCRYKSFVLALTKEHSGKDSKINIDDYFHIEDHREWTFFIGNQALISPWWDSGAARFFISCALLLGWPFRMSYAGQIAKHQVEVKKAVFCERTAPAAGSQEDEGVSLTATPGSGSNEQQQQQANGKGAAAAAGKEEAVVANDNTANAKSANSPVTEPDGVDLPPAAAAAAAATTTVAVSTQIDQPPLLQQSNPSPALHLDVGTQVRAIPQPQQPRQQQQQQLVNAVISNPPPAQHVPHGNLPPSLNQPAPKHSHHHHHHQHHRQQPQGLYAPTTGAAALPPALTPPMPPQRSAPLASPRTHLRDATKDIVTAVTHQDINGVSAVNTIALKDVSVEMSALSGYETYV